MFEKLYGEIRKLLEESDYENTEWVKEVSTKLDEIKSYWPSGKITDIASNLNDFEERTKMIYRLSYLPIKKRTEKLSNHGSIHFMFLEGYMSEEDINDLLEDFWSSKRAKTKLLIRNAFARLNTINREKHKKEKTPEEILIIKLNKLPKHYWLLLYEDAVSWEYNPKVLAILKKLDKTNARILKNEEMLMLESLRHMIEKNYIKKLDSNDNRFEAYNSFIAIME